MVSASALYHLTFDAGLLNKAAPIEKIGFFGDDVCGNVTWIRAYLPDRRQACYLRCNVETGVPSREKAGMLFAL
jgi:hypothetical protein